VAALTRQTCPAQRQAFFVFFVVTKKMTMLSGNPKGIAFFFEFLSTTKKARQ